MSANNHNHIISFYNKGIYFIYTTSNDSHFKTVLDLDEDRQMRLTHLFNFLCATCKIVHITPDKKVNEIALKVLKNQL